MAQAKSKKDLHVYECFFLKGGHDDVKPHLAEAIHNSIERQKREDHEKWDSSTPFLLQVGAWRLIFTSRSFEHETSNASSQSEENEIEH